MEPVPVRAMPIRLFVPVLVLPSRLPAQAQELELEQARELSIRAAVLAQLATPAQESAQDSAQNSARIQRQWQEQQRGSEAQRYMAQAQAQAPARALAPPPQQPSHHSGNRRSGCWQVLLKNSTEVDSIAKQRLPRSTRLHPGSGSSHLALHRCTSPNRHRTEPRDCPASSSSAAQAQPLCPAEVPRVVPASRLPAQQRLRARAPEEAVARMRAAWVLRLKSEAAAY